MMDEGKIIDAERLKEKFPEIWGEKTEITYQDIEKVAKDVPAYKKVGNQTILSIGNICDTDKWYRMTKWVAKIDGVFLWDCPNVQLLKRYSGVELTEIDLPYHHGAEKQYVAVYLLPVGVKVKVTGLYIRENRKETQKGFVVET